MNYLEKLFYFQRIMKNQWLEPEKLKKMQNIKLKKLINHAYNNVFFYRLLFKKNGISPSDIQTVDDLYKLPIITKQDIQKSQKLIIAKGFTIKNSHKIRTAGSTGIPLNIYHDNHSKEINNLVFLRAQLNVGMKFFDKIVHIYDPRFYKVLVSHSMMERLKIFRNEFFSLFENLEDCIQFLQKTKPDIISSYPSYLQVLARELKKEHQIKPRIIFTSSELLTSKEKSYLIDVFDTELFDFYSSSEFGLVGWECKEHMGFHINSDNLIAEFLKNNENVNENEKGEIVITSLNNYAMPFIRYKIGDIGTVNDELCSCGRGLEIMKYFEGRKDDLIILPSGRIITPKFFINVLEYIEGIKQNRVIQQKEDEILIKIAIDENFDTKKMGDIKKEIKRNLLNEDVEIKIKIVNKIPRDKTGKIRTVISNIKKIDV